MEKHGDFWNLSRSLLGLVLFILSFFCVPLQGTILLEQPNYSTSAEFNFSGLNSISYFFFTSEKWKVPLDSLLKTIVQDKVKIISIGKDSVDACALISKVNFYINLSKIKENLFLLSVNAFVNGTTETNFKGKISVFGHSFVIETNKQFKNEIENQIKKILNEFVQEYFKSNSSNLKDVCFFIVN